MADLNVSLITDLSGKPLPQIYIDALKKMGVTQGDADGNQYVKDKATLDAIIQMHNTIKNAPETDYAGIIDGLTSVKASVEANKPKELQSVQDTEVKSELEAIKQSVADNKATNDLILARLDGTLDTQLTGSNVAHSEDERPAGKNGDSLFLWDTREVFLHDGTDWREV